MGICGLVFVAIKPKYVFCVEMFLLVNKLQFMSEYLEALIFRFRFSPFPVQNLINSVFSRFRFKFCFPL